ncbi:restriction endonuclease subunit S [Streptococcus mitis]|uniref:restriction endonuclease subunit S n=1 Tax=Streptococcus mitis TaxID=28037 RepID=UPI001BE3FEAC|nr:restriction endonuclease subunit S [Streptococcus mitis]MBT2164233.1 restriction endonuclease subunit S [Streptococcus mitis]
MKKVKLGEVCEIRIGKTPNRSQTLYWGGNYPWLSISDMKGKILCTTKEKITQEAVQKEKMQIVSKGTVVMSFKLSIGKVGILAENMYTNEAIANFVIKNKKMLFNEYLYYALQGMNFDSLTDRAVMGKTLNKAKLNNLSIVYYEPFMQQQIVLRLDGVDKLIESRKQQLSELSELVKSRFNEMFGDFYTTLFPKYKIGEKFELSSGSTPSRDNKLYWDSGTINWVKTTEVINKEITETEEKITKFALENTSLKLFPVNTILIAMYGQGQTRGRSAILKVESTSNQACGAIFPNKIDNPVFIWHQLMLRYSELRELGRGGNQPNLNGQLIKNFELILPPLSLQNEFADFVAQVDKSQLAIQKSLEELETLKKSLMQEYFG